MSSVFFTFHIVNYSRIHLQIFICERGQLSKQWSLVWEWLCAGSGHQLFPATLSAIGYNTGHALFHIDFLRTVGQLYYLPLQISFSAATQYLCDYQTDGMSLSYLDNKFYANFFSISFPEQFSFCDRIWLQFFSFHYRMMK